MNEPRDWISDDDYEYTDLGPEPPKERRRRLRLLAVSAVLGFVTGVSLFVVNLPLFAIEPGGAFPTGEFVEVNGIETFDDPGEVLFVTVQQRRVSLAGWFVAQIRRDVDLFPEEALLGDGTVEDQREQSAQRMVASQNASVAAALGNLGFDTTDTTGVLVISVANGSPADGLIEVGDVIQQINGEPVSGVEQMNAVLDVVEPGSTVTVGVGQPGTLLRDVEVPATGNSQGFIGLIGDRTARGAGGAMIEDVVPGSPAEGLFSPGDFVVSVDGQAVADWAALTVLLDNRAAGETVTVGTTSADGPSETDVTLFGNPLEVIGVREAITLFEDVDTPFDVRFTTEGIGGPSAGLAFTLSVMDLLTEGELTGGATVAVTGSINRQGDVGPVGGVPQKAFSAKAAGADVFIVPAINFPEVDGLLDGLRVEPVETLDEALAILDEFGGNSQQLPDLAAAVR